MRKNGSILNGVDDDFSIPFFCIHKISSQCYKMKLYKCSWIYHSHLRFRLTLRDIHRWFAKLERAATSVARSTTLPGCGWHHNAYPPETTAGGSVFREAVSKTLPASASDQRNAFPEVIKIPESKATAFQTLDSAVYSFNRTVGEIILDAVKTSCMMWKRSMMIRAFGNNALMYWAFRSTTTDFTAAFSQCLLA